MSTLYWTGNAHATKQIDTITISGAWAAADTVVMTINGKDLTVTIANGTTTAQVAASIRDAWNAQSRLDGQPDTTNTNTSNFGGQEHGEFSEASATIYDASTSVVQIIATKPGVPFSLSVVATTAGSGDAVEATAQAATGPHHWNNGDNWIDDTGAAGVPATGDILTFRDSSVSIKYGLPLGTLNVTLVVYKSFTGAIGLPETNNENASKPYREYRQRVARFDDDGASDDTLTHIFGLGEGTGSPLMNIEHINTAGTPGALTVSAIVYDTGVPQIPGTKALNLLIVNTGIAGGTVTVLKGSVAIKDNIDGDAPVFTTLNIGYTNNQASDSDIVLQNVTGNITINQSGGLFTITEPPTVTASGTRTLNISGGTCICRDLSTSGNVTVTLLNCTFVYNTSKTITALIVGTGAIFDLEKDSRAVTMTTCDLFEGASLFDEFARGTYTAGIDLNRCGIDDVTIRVGNNRRLTLGTAA